MVVLETLRKMYNITVRGSPLVAQAIAEFQNNFHIDQNDLTEFSKLNGLEVLMPLKVNKHLGLPDSGVVTSREAMLDMQYMAGIGLSNSNWVVNSEHWIFELTQLLHGDRF
jgi:hypothetical protein